MNKKIVIIISIIFIFIAGYFMYANFFLKNLTPSPKYPETEETSCISDSDCVLSGNHPKYEAICVNKEWQETWNGNPESENYARNCLIGTICSGPEFVAGGMKMPENDCQCVNNHCQPVDLTNYPGCQFLGC